MVTTRSATRLANATSMTLDLDCWSEVMDMLATAAYNDAAAAMKMQASLPYTEYGYEEDDYKMCWAYMIHGIAKKVSAALQPLLLVSKIHNEAVSTWLKRKTGELKSRVAQNDLGKMFLDELDKVYLLESALPFSAHGLLMYHTTSRQQIHWFMYSFLQWGAISCPSAVRMEYRAPDNDEAPSDDEPAVGSMNHWFVRDFARNMICYWKLPEDPESDEAEWGCSEQYAPHFRIDLCEAHSHWQHGRTPDFLITTIGAPFGSFGECQYLKDAANVMVIPDGNETSAYVSFYNGGAKKVTAEGKAYGCLVPFKALRDLASM